MKKQSIKTKNIFLDIPKSLPDELFEIIVQTGNIKIERIVSKGHSSPKDFWYDQDQNEWVLVLKGKAEILIKDHDGPILLKEGDYLNIPAHVNHRVESTDKEQETIWLAVFY